MVDKATTIHPPSGEWITSSELADRPSSVNHTAGIVINPVISDFSPEEILFLTPVEVTVTIGGDATLSRVVISVQFDNSEPVEMIYSTDTGYTGLYVAQSVVLTVSGGYRYLFARTGGWGPNPEFHCSASGSTGGSTYV